MPSSLKRFVGKTKLDLAYDTSTLDVCFYSKCLSKTLLAPNIATCSLLFTATFSSVSSVTFYGYLSENIADAYLQVVDWDSLIETVSMKL